MNLPTYYPLRRALERHSTIYAAGTKSGNRIVVEVTGRAEALVLVNGKAHRCHDMLQIIALLNPLMERDLWSLRPPSFSEQE